MELPPPSSHATSAMAEGDYGATNYRRLSIGISPRTVDPHQVFSEPEIELFHQKFALFNPNNNKSRSLSAAHATKLFRDDFPTLSEWEIQELFHKCDLNCDGQLSLHEYLQTRAFHRLVVEANNELELVRSFAILDTDGDGIIVADEILALVEQAKQPGARLLRQVILQAAAATKEEADHHHHHHQQQHRHRHHKQQLDYDTRPGEITLDHFVRSIRDVNRTVEQEIATKTLRLLLLENKRQELHKEVETTTSLSMSTLQRGNLTAAIQSTKIEIDVLKHEVARAKKELFTDAGSNCALTKVCETLVATYENEQHVYECLSNFFTYCGLKNADVFRYNLEQSSREVHVLDSILMSPPAHVTKSAEYAAMMELSIYHVSSGSQNNHDQSHHHHTSGSSKPAVQSTDTDNDTASQAQDASGRFGHLFTNATLRKQFVFYTMLSDATNLESMTRTSFLKFAKDCDLHKLHEPPLTDPDLCSVYARATTTGSNTSGIKQHHRAAGMSFHQWLLACELLLHKTRVIAPHEEEPLGVDQQLESFLKIHVMPKAKCIHTQNIAPDISQAHVLKLLRESLWPLRQLFSHVGEQSLLDVTGWKATIDMRTFLSFACAFNIVRASSERDGEPYSAPPLTESTVIQPISLMELIREFYAAKLDINLANAARRDALDLNFREFVRCLQRVALAMHGSRRRQYIAPNGIMTTSFEAIKSDDDGDDGGGQRRPPCPVETPLYRRRGNMVGAATSPTKNCKMTSTSIISKLLHTTRELAARASGTIRDDELGTSVCSSSPPRRPLLSPQQRSPTMIFYGSSMIASVIPVLPLALLETQLSGGSPRFQPSHTPASSHPNEATKTPLSPRTPRTPGTPRTPRRQRPITCGGPPTVRTIVAPSTDL